MTTAPSSIERAHLKIIHALYAAFGQGEIPAVLSMLDPNVEWIVTGPPDTSYAGTRRGTAQVIEFFTILGKTIDILQFEPREFIAQGDAVVVIGQERMRIKATGRVAENPWVMVFTLREGRIARFREFDDTASVAAAFSHA